jgi:hypothetical protein
VRKYSSAGAVLKTEQYASRAHISETPVNAIALDSWTNLYQRSPTRQKLATSATYARLKPLRYSSLPAALQAPRVAHADPGFAAKETVPTVAEAAQSLAALRSAGGQ